MWPPEFVKLVRKQIQNKSSIPILDVNWRHVFEKTIELCRESIKENPALWKLRINELEELAQNITNHNQAIDQQYTKSILSLFEGLPEICAEIQQQFVDGYILVGYKGIDLKSASRICENGLDNHKIEESPTGSSRGDGFYTTPHFDTALDFAKLAARLQGSLVDKTLLEPCVPFPDDYVANIRYRRKYKCFEERIWKFETTDEWKQYAIVIRVYIKDFFSMHGLILEDQRVALPVGWENFDYIEGRMQGGDDKMQWEIKFNPHKVVYANIKANSIPRVDVSYDLPLGCIQMLNEAHKILTESITHVTYVVGQNNNICQRTQRT